MNLDRITNISNLVNNDGKNENISLFFSELENLPQIISQSTMTFKDKLIELDKIGLFKTISTILHNTIHYTLEMKLIHFLDFLISTASSKSELEFLFTNGYLNFIIHYPYNFSFIDILQSYLTVLKGLSLKVKDIDTNLLFTSENINLNSKLLNEYEVEIYSSNDPSIDCPLFSHSLPFLIFDDSIVISSARCIILSLCLIPDSKMSNFICEKTPKSTIEKLIDTIDADGFAFLADFLNFAPPSLVSITLEILKSKLLNSTFEMISLAASFLENSPAKYVITEVISERLPTFDLSNPVALGLLLFGLEKKCILYDAALNCSLYKEDAIFVPNFNSIDPLQNSGFIPTGRNLKIMLENVFLKKQSITSVAICLDIFKILSPKIIPKIVYELRTVLINSLKVEANSGLMASLILPSQHKSRTDLEYLRDLKLDPISVSQMHLFQLAEVQNAIGRWTNKPFSWFSLPENVEVKSFENSSLMTEHQETLFISPQKIEIDGINTYKTKRIILQPRINGKNIVKFLYVQEPTSKRSSFSLVKKEEIQLNFLSSEDAKYFEEMIEKIQVQMINIMLDSLPN